MPQCIECGALNEAGAFSCIKCGAPLLLGLNLFQTLVEIRRSTVKKDDSMIKQNLLHGITAYTTEPANLGIQGGPSEGKSYPTVETLKLFPPTDVWFLAGLSPTALAHEHGVLVDLETREPLAPKLARIEGEIAEAKARKDKSKVQELRRQQAELLAKSAYLVDLENKILIFLDKPHPRTLEALYPILSHDVFESMHKFTDRKEKGPLKTVTVILRGWPVAVFCRTTQETDSDTWLQTISRFTTISPAMGPEKYREAIKLRAAVRGLPGAVLVRKLGLNNEEWARRALAKVRDELNKIKTKVRETCGNPKVSMFWIPFYAKIGKEFPADIGRRMRDSDRFLALIQAHAAINVFARPRLVFPDGSEYIICTREDYEDVTELYFSEEEKLTILTGLSRNIIEFFEKVLVPLWKEKGPVAVGDLVTGCLERLGKSLSDDTIRQHYLKPLSNAGFIAFEEDPEDRRRKLVRVLREDIEKTRNSTILQNALNFSLEELKEAWNELQQLSAHNPCAKIINFDGRELTIEELYELYYKEQGGCADIFLGENQGASQQLNNEITRKNENRGNADFSRKINLDLKRIKGVRQLDEPLVGWCDNCCLERSERHKVILRHRAEAFDDSVFLLCEDCAQAIIKALKEGQA